MFDVGWSELLLIGAVALVVIGPKDLPKALRTLGQITAKMKRMAAEFQSQFNEAMREAELDELRRDVSKVGDTAKELTQNFNPIQTIRDEIKGAIETRPANPAVPPEDAAPVIPEAPGLIEPVAEPMQLGTPAETPAQIVATPISTASPLPAHDEAAEPVAQPPQETGGSPVTPPKAGSSAA